MIDLMCYPERGGVFMKNMKTVPAVPLMSRKGSDTARY